MGVLFQIEVLFAVFCFRLKYCLFCSVSDWSIVCCVLFQIEVLFAVFCFRLKYCLLCSVSGWSAHIVQLNRIQQMLGIYSSNCPCFLLPDSCPSVLCTSFTFVVDVCRTGYLNSISGICCPTWSALIVNKQMYTWEETDPLHFSSLGGGSYCLHCCRVLCKWWGR